MAPTRDHIPPTAAPTTTGSSSGPASVWLAWAIAAAVLLAVPGTVIPVLGVIDRAEVAHLATEEATARLAVAATEKERAAEDLLERRRRATDNLAVAKQAQVNLLASWLKEEKTIEKRQADRKLTVEVHKPATAQPGAPNEFLLVLHEQGHGPSPNKRLLAEVRDQTDAVIYSQRLDPEKRDNFQVVRLPAETWAKLTPESELFLAFATLDEKTGTKAELQEKVRLFGPVYATMLTTDRAMYRPGDTVYFRSLTLDRVTFRPPQREQFLQYELLGPLQHPAIDRTESGGTDLVRVVGGKVEPVLGPDGKPVRGVGCGAFLLPPEVADGDYTLTLREQQHPAGYPSTVPASVVRTFKVRSGAADQYAKRIDYAKASYSPGNTVEAIAELRFRNQPLAGARVTAVAIIDQAREIRMTGPPTDSAGRSRLQFTLPKEVKQGDVRLRVTFHANDRDEWVAERVPVVGRKVIVEFFPEGGVMVAGVPCRVYFRATTPTGQPVDIRGKVTGGRKVLAAVETNTDPNQPAANRGIGSFTFTPSLNAPAQLTLDVPNQALAPLLDAAVPLGPTMVTGAPAVTSSLTGFALPKPEGQGVVMSVENPVTRPGEPFRVRLTSPDQQRNLVVGAYTRGRLSDTKRITTQLGHPSLVELMGGPDPRGGVVRITVFEEPAERAATPGEAKPDLKAVAERLVFRRPGEVLNLAVAPVGARAEDGGFMANSPLELDIAATDEAGRPKPAVLWASVVNSAVEPGKRERSLTTHFLLAGEISTPDAMEYADFLLTDQPRAAECLDLVLATQGWRRFVEQTPIRPIAQALNRFRDTADPDRMRLAAVDGLSAISTEQPISHDRRLLFERYWPRYQDAVKAVAAAQSAQDSENPVAATRMAESLKTAEQARAEALSAVENARAAAFPVGRIRSAAGYGILGFALLAVMLAGLATARPLARLPYGLGTIAAIGLVAFLVSAIGMAERTEAAIHSTGELPAQSKPTAETPNDTAMGDPKTPERKAGAAGEVQDALPSPKAGGLQSFGMTPNRPENLGAGKASPSAPPPGLPAGAAGAFGGATKNAAGVPPKPPGAAPAGPPPKPVPEREEVPVKGARADREGAPISGEGLRGGLQRRNIPDWLTEATTMTDETGQRRLSEGAIAQEEEQLKRSRELLKEYVKRAPEMGPVLRQVYSEKQPKGLSTAPREGRGLGRLSMNHSPLIVREYAAPRPGSGADSIPSDTILWQPVIVLPGDGKMTLPLQLGSAKGGYQVSIAGHTLDGRIGAVRQFLPVAQPQPNAPVVPIPPKMP